MQSKNTSSIMQLRKSFSFKCATNEVLIILNYLKHWTTTRHPLGEFSTLRAWIFFLLECISFSMFGARENGACGGLVANESHGGRAVKNYLSVPVPPISSQNFFYPGLGRRIFVLLITTQLLFNSGYNFLINLHNTRDIFSHPNYRLHN